ncbi:hypothetical protein PBY51_011219 [Eleginops maclovinus]|uniref:Probable proton-coupled zinc antiporter SLC30A3 n=1 Tax=Eleginops maclovinus TaxID=56733 RepID=A0AAN7X7X5_ELEMC|nr:hypothetical protein PBY51_011219 [Eleginops maclovinus]
MDLPEDLEKQPLIQLDPLRWSSSPEDRCSDSDSGADDPGFPSRFCRDSDSLPEESVARRSARRKLIMAAAVSLLFMTGEVVGGYLAHSLAIMTDAAHLLTDVCSILISCFSLWLSSRPQTPTMTFGWHRAEVLGMLLSVVSIWGVTVLLVVSAAQRISDGDFDIDSQIMLITSGGAVGVNVLMVLILHQSGASHGHSHSSPPARLQTADLRPDLHPDPNPDLHPDPHPDLHHEHNASVRAAFVHVVGDLLQSVGVLLAATIIHFRPEYKVADPICTFLFSVLVLGTTLPISKDVFRILMEGSPEEVISVRERLLALRGVRSVHALHVWSLNLTKHFLSAHLSTEADADPLLVLSEASQLLRSEFGFCSVTLQVEP